MAFSKFPPSVRERHALIVEDDLREWEVIGNAFKYFGMRHIVFAESGARAREILEEGLAGGEGSPVDLAIVDVQGGAMSGPDLVRYIREKEPIKALPIIVLAADVTVEFVQELSGLSISALLLKPVAPADIAEKVCEILQGTQPLRKDRLAG